MTNIFANKLKLLAYNTQKNVMQNYFILFLLFKCIKSLLIFNTEHELYRVKSFKEQGCSDNL